MSNWASDTMTITLVPTEDYIYIGCPHTFTARFIHMDGLNVNAVSSVLSCEYYYGRTLWRSVKNFTDETKSGAVTLAKSGFISWDLPDDWISCQVNSVPELKYTENAGDGKGYYWIRLKASVTLTATTKIKFLGVIWTNHAYIENRFNEITSSKYLPTGKTDWYEVIEQSTQDVVNDLELSNIIDYELQAKDISEMANLTAYKTLINILAPMTSSETLRTIREEYKIDYNNLLRKRFKSIDQNKDERLSEEEKRPMTNSVILRS